MAQASDIDTDLTLEISGNNVTPEKFVRGVRSFFAILNEVTRQVAGRPNAVEWTVQVKDGSNLIGLSYRPGFDPALAGQIIDAVSAGIAKLEDETVRPDYFNERAIKSLRELGGVVGRTDDDDTAVKVWARRQPVPVSYSAVAHVNALLASEHSDYGSIEGRLQTVTERGRLQFLVYEPLWDEQVRCYIPDDLVDEAIQSFRHRVEVYGVIRYRKDGKPVSIEVDEIVPFPDPSDIPSFRDVHGLLREAF